MKNKEKNKTKNKLTLKGVLSPMAIVTQIIGIVGVMLVFPQSHFGYTRNVTNTINGVATYINSEDEKVNELKDIKYLNKNIIFTKSSISDWDIIYKSEIKEIESNKDGESSLVIPKVEQKIATATLTGEKWTSMIYQKGLSTLWNTKTTGADSPHDYYETLFSGTWEKDGKTISFKTGNFGYYVIDDKNSSLGSKDVAESATMLFLTNGTIAEDIGGTFGYEYFPWGSETFMTPFFSNYKNLKIMIGFSFLLFLSSIGATSSMISKISKNERPSKGSMGFLALANIAATTLSASLVSIISGGIGSLVLLFLMTETVIKNKDGYKNDKINSIKENIERLNEKIEFSENEDDIAFYKEELKKQKNKLSN